LKEFKELQLKPELVSALANIGFTTMTEVQEASIPVALSGKDMIVRAKTGTGKTGAFMVPILQTMQRERVTNALIIAPTRELALQITEMIEKVSRPLGYSIVTVYGGASINVQLSLLRRGANIVVGTPGRIIDLMERGALDLGHIRFLVLDEADTMLDMGFIEDVEYIISRSPFERQTMLFSATMPKGVVDVARHHMKDDFKTIIVGKEEELTVNTITHNYFFAKGKMKYAALLAYIKQYNPQKTIIFSRTKHDANVIHMILRKQGYNAMLMHGGLTQAKREKSLDSFRLGAQFMIATNVASRGLDIDNVTDIINFDAPEDPHVYVHRVGRSARMGRDGRAFTIVGYDEKGLIRAIEYDANVRMQQIELKVDDFMNLDVLNHLHERRFEGREDMNRRPHRDSRSRDGNRKGGGGDNRWKHKRREFGPRREFRPHT